MTLPDAQGSPPGTVWTSAVTLVGTRDGTTFTVVRRDDASPPASTTTPPPRCDAPSETRLGQPMFADQIQQALQPYLDAHGDTVGESWWNDANQTVILGFSDAPENHLAEVRSILARTCVVQVAHSRSEVNAYKDRLMRSAADHNIHLYSVSANPESLAINPLPRRRGSRRGAGGVDPREPRRPHFGEASARPPRRLMPRPSGFCGRRPGTIWEPTK